MKLLLNKTMIDYANDFYNKQKLLYIGNEDKLKDLTKKINSYKKYCNMSQSINNIVSAVKNILKTKEQGDIFDNHPYIFCFTNKAFNLLNGEEVELTKEHYITQNTGYAYKTPTNEQTQLIDKLFCQIFPNEEIRKCCLSVFFSGMTGIPAEKFILFNGRGRNGKGLLDAHFSYMLGNDYCLKFNSVVLIKDDKDAGSANPILTQFHKMRYGFVEEFPDMAKLNLTIVKLLTGGGDLKARELYGAVKTINNLITLAIECNVRPEMNGKITQSITDRFIDIHFESYFTDDVARLNEENVFQINENYKETNFKMEHRYAFFKYILDNAPKKIYVPQIVKDRSLSYIEECDEIVVWLKENYIQEQGKYITIKDLYEDFKKTELFYNDYKKMILKKFKSHLSRNPLTQSNIHDRKKVNGRDLTNILLNWTKKETEINIDIY